jgi:histidinol-phosphate/aromatic aminotransferase/cobyric acid decarboxylase-like protein
MGMQLARVPGLSVYSSQGNFLLVKLGQGMDGTELRDHLLTRHQVFIRECGNKLGMSSQFLRLVVRPQQDVARLMEGLDDYLQPRWSDELAQRRDARTA